MSARDRVLAALRAARRLTDRADPLGRAARERLVTTSGLSPEGVALALDEHLETEVSDTELEALLDVDASSRCHLVLAANVCTAPLRAIACALASSATVFVRPSRRDPVVTELLAHALDEDAAFTGTVALVDRIEPATGDAVHVYGRDETIATYRSQLPDGARLHGHGTGLGVAVVESNADLIDAAVAFATDLVPFDGRGCLSPRVVLVAGDPRTPAARARAFAIAAAEALARLGERVPRGPLQAPDAAALRQYADTMTAIGEAFEGPHHLLGLDLDPHESGETLPVGPALRCALVLPVLAGLLPEGLPPLASSVTAIGSAGDGLLTEAIAALAPRARRSPLGRMQRPPLDGPVDLRPFTTATE
ncbi:MAG TPA: proline dehydrogenase [Polyangiaceae bacterium]|nr:proline dehydrogenase [Polyangiaceae bacterium]